MQHFKKYLVIVGVLTIAIGVADSVSAQPSQRFNIKSFKLDLCFDVANNRVFNGAVIQVARCKGVGHPAQTWIQGNQVLDDRCTPGEGNCQYQIKLAANPNFCLDYRYSTKPPDEGVGLQLWQCRDRRNGDAAYWGFVLGQGYQAFKIYPGIPGLGTFNKYASIPFNAGEGTRIQLRTEDQDKYYRFWVHQY